MKGCADMRKTLATIVSAVVLAAGLAVATPAEAAVPIRCSTRVALSYGDAHAKATIVSNKRIYKGQTSFIFYYKTPQRKYGQLKYVGGYGATLTVGVKYVYSVATWHAGTRCAQWNKPGAV